MKLTINGTNYEALSFQSRAKDSVWNNRESKAVTLAMTYTDAIALFVDDLQWSMEYVYTDENDIQQNVVIDLCDYAMAGPVTDNRDGTVTVKMGKYLQDELMLIPLSEPPKDHKEADVWREAIEVAMQSIENDQLALAASPLYPTWKDLVNAGTPIGYGFRFRHDGYLYKSQMQADHVPSEQWVPGVGTESMYIRIDETHAGTSDDPIPYNSNMVLENGLYYVQDGIVYLCVRDTVNPVYSMLSELVGIYVEAVV